MTVVDGVRMRRVNLEVGVARPIFHVVLRAYADLLDSGREPSNVNLAKELGISRQAVHQMFIRYPDLMPFIDRHIGAANEHYVGSVVRRIAMLAMKGSPQHAEMFLKFSGGGFVPRAFAADDDAPAPTNVSNYILNMLVPRPAVPGGERAAELLPALPAPPLPDIPVVVTR